MEYTKDLKENLKVKIQYILSGLQMDQERRSLRLAQQFGYLTYVRLFVESQKRKSLQPYFPYAGFPMEWTRGDETMEDQQRVWQLQYQIQYCSSIVEEGHFMEQAWTSDNARWLTELCKLIDWIADQCSWDEEMPELFGTALEEMVGQIYRLGNSGMFLMPEVLTDMLIELTNEAGKSPVLTVWEEAKAAEGSQERETTRKIVNAAETEREGANEGHLSGREADRGREFRVWNPSCRTGAFLAALYRSRPQWRLIGSEEEKEQACLARMLQFYHGAGNGVILRENPLEHTHQEYYDLIVTNPPVGELDIQQQERFPIVTRKVQLQYLQLVMDHLAPGGMAVAVVNEGSLFKFEAEMKVRRRLMEEYDLKGVISLPAGAFLPYTASKASVLIFTNAAGKTEENEAVLFYELQNPGYTLDKRQEPTDDSQIPELLQVWEKLGDLYKEWKHQLAAGERRNQWENPVPEEWEHHHFWFADKSTICRNDYNLTTGRYKPWREVQEEASESPLELLQQLASLERETMEQMKELIDMTKNYG